MYSLLKWLLILATIILAVALVIMVIKKLQKVQGNGGFRGDSRKWHIQNPAKRSTINKLSKTVSGSQLKMTSAQPVREVELLNKIKILENEKDALLTENIELGHRIDQLKAELIVYNLPLNKISKEKPSEVKPLSTIYFTMPESTGEFVVENGSSTRERNHFYGITYRKHEETGEIKFLSGSSDKRAINGFESQLKPVCEIENIQLGTSASRVDLIRPGKVYLRNNRWVIDPQQMVKVRLA